MKQDKIQGVYSWLEYQEANEETLSELEFRLAKSRKIGFSIDADEILNGFEDLSEWRLPTKFN